MGPTARYRLQLALPARYRGADRGEAAVLKALRSGIGRPLIQDKDSKGALYVLMPMRV